MTCQASLGRLDIAEDVEVPLVDHAGLHQGLEIDDAPPVGGIEQKDRHSPRLAGLDEAEGLEQLVHGAEAAGEDHQRPRPRQEVHLAEREIVELEAELGRHVGVWRLLVRQDDIVADARAPVSAAPRFAASMMPGPPPVTMV